MQVFIQACHICNPLQHKHHILWISVSN